MFPPKGYRKSKRISKRDLSLTEGNGFICSDSKQCDQCEKCKININKSSNKTTQGEKSKFSYQENKDGNARKINDEPIPFIRAKASGKANDANEKLKFSNNVNASRKVETLQRTIRNVNLTASVLSN